MDAEIAKKGKRTVTPVPKGPDADDGFIKNLCPLLIPIVILGIVIGYGVALAGYRVRLRADIITMGYQLAQERTVQERLHQQKKSLLIEASTLSDPGLLTEVVTKESGLSLPGKGNVRRLRGPSTTASAHNRSARSHRAKGRQDGQGMGEGSKLP